jgi:RND family efflux transporter MFP subunit
MTLEGKTMMEVRESQETGNLLEGDWAARWLVAISAVWDDLVEAVLQLPPAPGSDAPRVLRWPEGSPASPAILSAVSRSHKDRRMEVREIVRTQAKGTLVALPLDGPLGDSTLSGGVLALHVRHETDMDPIAERKRVVAQAEAMLSTLTPALRERGARERLSLALEVVAAGLEWEACGAASLAVATQLALRMQCDRVAIVFRDRDTPWIEAVSNSARVDRRSCWASSLGAAVTEAVDQDATVCVPAPSGRASVASLAHVRLREEGSVKSVWTVPFAGSGGDARSAGAFCFESSIGAPDVETLELCEDVVALIGPVLELRRRERDSLSGRWSALLRPLRERAWRRNFIALASLALVLVALTPGNFRIEARAELQGRVVRSVAAGVEGYIREAHARAGDLVKEGSLLARLDDRDLQIEHRNWTGKSVQLEREYREALAQHDRSRSSVLDAQLAQARAELDLAVARLARTELVAPFDGIVMEGDWSQKLGAPVERGDVLFELAPLDGYRIVLEVDEREISHVELGQAGALALTARPGDPLPLTVRRVIPITVAEDGRTFFRVEADLDAPPGGLRPGMEGVAQLDAGQRQRLQIWTRPLVDAVRLWLWRWGV